MSISADDCIQLCNVGDTLYKISKGDIKEIHVMEVRKLPHLVYTDEWKTTYFNRNIGKTCFKTLEEAEAELHKRKLVAKKRQLLKEYESKLNDELGIIDHIIIV